MELKMCVKSQRDYLNDDQININVQAQIRNVKNCESGLTVIINLLSSNYHRTAMIWVLTSSEKISFALKI